MSLVTLLLLHGTGGTRKTDPLGQELLRRRILYTRRQVSEYGAPRFFAGSPRRFDHKLLVRTHELAGFVGGRRVRLRHSKVAPSATNGQREPAPSCAPGLCGRSEVRRCSVEPEARRPLRDAVSWPLRMTAYPPDNTQHLADILTEPAPTWTSAGATSAIYDLRGGR